jgi:hypothetical protein
VPEAGGSGGVRVESGSGCEQRKQAVLTPSCASGPAPTSRASLNRSTEGSRPSATRAITQIPRPRNGGGSVVLRVGRLFLCLGQ